MGLSLLEAVAGFLSRVNDAMTGIGAPDLNADGMTKMRPKFLDLAQPLVEYSTK
jgi:hypothetical protein